MANDMRPRYWKSLASASSSRLSVVKDYISQRDFKPRKDQRLGEPGYTEGESKRQSWAQWAGQKIAKRLDDVGGGGSEKVILFPGWASRKYHEGYSADIRGAPFDIEVFVSGYAVKQRALGAMSRSQKAFVKVAKGFASLPKLPDSHSPNASPHIDFISKSTEDLLADFELPPRPDEMDEELERRTLCNLASRDSSSTTLVSSGAPSIPSTLMPPIPPSTTSLSPDLHRLHLNLESRLHPFWAVALSQRTIKISLHPCTGNGGNRLSHSSDGSSTERSLLTSALAAQPVLTTTEGAFQNKFTIPWENLCTHPRGVHVAFGDPLEEHDFVIRAELLPPPPSASKPSSANSSPVAMYATLPPAPTAVTEEVVPLTYSPIRVISDIDDTVKLSNIISGARAMFYNVFVKDLKENVIRGMGEWYGEMWKRGVRFHYVSNSPFELLPVIHEFFQLAQLPPGSIRLRSYGTRSLFTGLLSAPAARKRAGVIDVLTSFPSSQFILVGDTGEQDLELYASIARERPSQILAMFVRDVNTYDDGEGGVEDPTGRAVLENPALAQALSPRPSGPRANSRNGMGLSVVTTPLVRTPKSADTPTPSETLVPPAPPFADGRTRSMSMDYFSHPGSRTPSRRSSPVLTAEPQQYGSPVAPPSMTPSSRSSSSSMSEDEKRRGALQTRVWKARLEAPPEIVLRVFREPEECIEARAILDQRNLQSAAPRSPLLF